MNICVLFSLIVLILSPGHAQFHDNQQPFVNEEVSATDTVSLRSIWQEFRRDPKIYPCFRLRKRFPYKVTFPGNKTYYEARKRYWNAIQTGLFPACRFFPIDTSDVRDGLALLISHDIPFAIVSGGHSGKLSASNINKPGITIDLSLLNEISLTQDGRHVQVGPGASWSDVYAYLEPYELVVAGIRFGNVGVGGSILGGGLSWFSNQHGWTCDSVIEFEIVTQDARVLHVNKSSHPDLFEATKGSLGTLGVVTGFTMQTIRSFHQVYGGAIVYKLDKLPVLFPALREMAFETNRLPDPDLFTHGYISIGYFPSNQSFNTVAYLVNTLANRSAPLLESFRGIRHESHNLNTKTVFEIAKELADSDSIGFRRIKFTLTALIYVEAMNALHEAFMDSINRFDFDAESLFGITYQPLTYSHIRAQDNIFVESLDGSDGPLLLVSVELWWTDESKDRHFEDQAKFLHDTMVYQLKRRRMFHPWVYPNYAAKWQSPFGYLSIGGSTFNRLEMVRAKYDPDDVWRRPVPGVW